MNEKLKSLFEDLGKPTLRGVRKCHKCGTYNGTRGISCKNKSCNAVFKETTEKKRITSVDAVKIITGTTAQVFSVRVRDRGPDYRSFVQLPLLQNLDTTDQTASGNIMSPARCFVENCHKSNNTHKQGTTFSPIVPVNLCQHIKAATQCFTEAQPLTLKNSVLNALQVSNEIKQAIWLLATESTGPLVQRVSKNVMVVKCKPNPKHPLGFLHFSFFETTRNREAPEHKFHCSCRAFRMPKTVSVKEDSQKRCVHFYACVCAFASNDKLAEEFSYYINIDLLESPNPENQLVALLANGQQQLCEMEMIPDESPPPLLVQQVKKRKRDENLVQASNALLTLQDGSNTPNRKTIVKKSQGLNQKKTGNVPVDETQVSLSFHQWLASITERINQTMHYQFDGNPEPLVFHAPQVFFDCLQQRISSGSKKKRLPNSTTGFIRKDALPLGTFSKYTWHITNILQVKQIFDTPEMPLEVLRSFVENRDGTYDLYEPPKSQLENNAEVFRKTDHQPLIKPFELKTFLKVGNTSSDQKEPTPFIIEWIPEILPKMKIGELRIKFEYGHQRNGSIEHRTVPTQPVIQIQSL